MEPTIIELRPGLDDIIAAVREALLTRVERDVRAIEHATADLGRARQRHARLDAVIRTAHTLKGTAGTVGLADIGRAASDVESAARAPRVSRVRLAAAVGRLAVEARRAAGASCPTAPSPAA